MTSAQRRLEVDQFLKKRKGGCLDLFLTRGEEVQNPKAQKNFMSRIHLELIYFYVRFRFRQHLDLN